MATEQQMRFALQAYIDRFNARDGEGLAALFADNARIEDPVGGTMIVEGRAAIDDFYRGAVTMVDRLELVAPIRTIDVMTFDAEGKIVDMRAYHGPGDVEVGG